MAVHAEVELKQVVKRMRRSDLKKLFTLLLGASALTLASGFAPIEELRRHTAALLPLKKETPTLKNWGLNNSMGDSHIHAVDAWSIEEGSHNVIVAVIDTGVDPSHEALLENMWNEKGARTPVFGWNFVNNQANPRDDHGHGTHVAGIIGAVTNSKTGVSGVSPHVSIMAVKYYSEANTGAVNLNNTVKAIEYAVNHGAKIINYSGGGPEFSEEEYMAIRKAEAKGVLFVAAAGNEHQDTDQIQNYYYPAAYQLSNIISVAATDINNNLLPSSNWGKKRVNVAAPGENIYSTLPGGRYGHMTGTSQATAFVSGVAALLLAQNPNLTPVELKSLIKASVDGIPQLRERVASGGKINAHSALMALKNLKQSAPVFAARQPVSLLQGLGLQRQ